eukprot:SAG31_NODE_31819_length_363_cov_2.083333_1_plen_35_part_01
MGGDEGGGSLTAQQVEALIEARVKMELASQQQLTA